MTVRGRGRTALPGTASAPAASVSAPNPSIRLTPARRAEVPTFAALSVTEHVVPKAFLPAAVPSPTVAPLAANPIVIAPSPPSLLSEAVAATAVGPVDPIAPPVATAAPAPAASGSVSNAGPGLAALLGGGDGDGPVAAPLAWTALAASRRELGGAPRTSLPAAALTTGDPAVPVAGSAATGAASTAAAVGADVAQAFVKSIGLPARWTYGTGKALTFTLRFNERVQVVDPNVTLPVQVGFAMRDAEYVGGSGTRTLTFRLKATANDVGAVDIGRVSTALQPGATAPARIFDFNGAGQEQPPTPVANPKIVDMAGHAVSETIPTVNTAGIEVDARGPGVVSYGNNGAISTWDGPLGLVHLAWVKVKFDSPVVVKGKPTVAVNVAGVNAQLRCLGGWGGSTLTFGMVRLGADPGAVTFGTQGQVIDLPSGADIKDRLGNSAPVIRGDFGHEPGTLGPPLVENGNTMVVLGAHYEYLDTVSVDQLNTVLTTEAREFYNNSTIDPATGQDPAPYLVDYQMPTFVPATHAVDLYRVAYASTIPEQGNRPTTAYGLVAIPQGTTGPLPIMSYQHGTIIGKGEVPSQSFDWMLNPGPDLDLYKSSYETRLNVAQFGGQGYAVIAADYFGVGNSIENDGYISKPSQQQATLDMYNASLKLLAAQNKTASDLFLGGWSQGGLVTVDFLEKLESLDIPVRGAATASAPANVQLTSNAWYFNPRQYTQTNTGDAPWLNVVGELSNFSITGYAGYTGSPLQMLGVNYEAARAMYMRQYDYLEYQPSLSGGIVVHRQGLADVVLPYSLQKVIAPQYSGVDNAVAFSQTDYGQLLVSSGAGQTYLASNMQMYYGSQDEVIPLFAGTAVYDWQTESFGKTNIAAVEVNAANHRGTFLSSVRGELEWFNSLRS